MTANDENANKTLIATSEVFEWNMQDSILTQDSNLRQDSNMMQQ